MKETNTFTPDEIKVLKTWQFTDDEIINLGRIECFYEDWLSGLIIRLGSFEWETPNTYITMATLHKPENKYKCCVISKQDFAKIISKRKEILNAVIAHYCDSSVNDFEMGFSHSGEPLAFIRLEKERVKGILNEKDFNGTFSYLPANGNTSGFNWDIAWGKIQYKSYKSDDHKWHNKIAFWHNEITVSAQYDLANDVGPEWIEKRPALNAPIAALVYHRYLRYLEEKERDINEPKDNMADTIEEAMTYKDTNPKKYFMSRVYLSTKGAIEEAQKDAEKEITGRKSRSTPQGFVKWLEQRNEELVNEPALKMLDNIPKITSSPENFTHYVTKHIDVFVPKPIDWGHHWEMAGKILFEIEDTSQVWKPYGLWVKSYYKGSIADTKAKAFAQYLEGIKPLQWQEETINKKKPRGRPKSEPYIFESLFKGKDKMQKLLDVAEQIKLIESTPNGYKWIEVKNQKGHHVRAFWYAADDALVTKKKFGDKEQICNAIRVFFDMKTMSKHTLRQDARNMCHNEYKRVKEQIKNLL